MKTIHKFPIQVGSDITTIIKVPRFAELLDVGLDANGVPVAWVKLNTAKPLIDELHITTVYTGSALPPDSSLLYKSRFILEGLIHHAFYTTVTSI